MMYVSGETAEASVETTGLIEEIVRQQVVEIVSLVNIFSEKHRPFADFSTHCPAPPMYGSCRKKRLEVDNY